MELVEKEDQRGNGCCSGTNVTVVEVVVAVVV